ncbi:hypothetical protein [Sphingobium sp. B11D3D]|uniref:hypothetical protein n=1 Tax=Sphingobium sp. B11D3D TaxID=2940576 RepID=UPI00222591DF|nr:hypothetical protein [Sphingobium sp. B11D3D]MCW2370068.1 hypothetical protein [Sphingobium sp. B11D3D]
MLPRPSNIVKSQVFGLARLLDGQVDLSPAGRALIDAGCVHMPHARLVILGTSCASPLLRDEADQVGRLLGCDMLLLRCEAGQGIRLDVCLTHKDGWLQAYLPWCGNGELWLVPSEAALHPIEVAGGLFERVHFPFASAQARSAGLDAAHRALSDLARWSI